jgi:hypothetical protein
LAPYYRVSGWLQGWFLTSAPTDEELEVAESALFALLEEVSLQKADCFEHKKEKP